VDLPGALLSGYWGGSTIGPKVPPGTYQVELTVAGTTMRAPLAVVLDPRVMASPEDLEAQYQLLLAIRDKLSEVHRAVLNARRVRAELDSFGEKLKARGHESEAEEVRAAAEAVLAVEGELHQAKSRGRADSFNYPPKVNSKLASLESTVAFGESRPPQQCYDVFELLRADADRQLRALDEVLSDRVEPLGLRLAQLGLPLFGE